MGINKYIIIPSTGPQYVNPVSNKWEEIIQLWNTGLVLEALPYKPASLSMSFMPLFLNDTPAPEEFSLTSLTTVLLAAKENFFGHPQWGRFCIFLVPLHRFIIVYRVGCGLLNVLITSANVLISILVSFLLAIVNALRKCICREWCKPEAGAIIGGSRERRVGPPPPENRPGSAYASSCLRGLHFGKEIKKC